MKGYRRTTARNARSGMGRRYSGLEPTLNPVDSVGGPSPYRLELGFDAVLLNTAVAKAGDPVAMAAAFAKAVDAGRQAFEATPLEPRDMAVPSTPVIGMAVFE